MKIFSRYLCLFLMLMLVISVASGCAADNKTTDGTPSSTQEKSEPKSEPKTEPKTEAKTEDKKEEPVETLPSGKITDKPITLRVWSSISAQEYAAMEAYENNYAVQKLMEQTGVYLKFEHPIPGTTSVQEHFNLMVASGDLVDIIFSYGDSIGKYPGGYLGAVRDSLLIDMSELIDKYAVYFKKYVLSDENYKRWVTSDDGTVVKFGSMVIPMQPSGRGKAYSGPMIRKDLLDMVGLPVPETIDEWYNLLKTFKTNFPDIMPFVWSAANNSQNSFTGAFDVQKGFYQVNGKVKYGPMEPGYLEFMRLMHQWTKEGLVSAEYVNVDQIMQALKGASCDISLYRYNTYRAKVIPQNPNAILVAAPYPVRKKGDVYHFGDEYVGVAFEGKFVTTACKYPVEAVKFIDYMYSPESSAMMNWGIEGESYVIVDGKRVETQRMKDPAERCKYILNQFRGFVDEDQNAQQYPFAEQHEAWEIWGSSGTDYKFPVGYTMTTEENTEYTQIMSEIDKFVNETYQAMILGKQSLDTFDQYVSKLKEMKIERALEIWQATLDRYYSR